MSRPIAAPVPGKAKEFPLHVHESVAFDLHVFCEAMSANWTKVINRAVRELIDRDLKENPGFRERFEQLRTNLLAQESRTNARRNDGIRLVDREHRTQKRDKPKTRSKPRTDGRGH